MRTKNPINDGAEYRISIRLFQHEMEDFERIRQIIIEQVGPHHVDVTQRTVLLELVDAYLNRHLDKRS